MVTYVVKRRRRQSARERRLGEVQRLVLDRRVRRDLPVVVPPVWDLVVVGRKGVVGAGKRYPHLVGYWDEAVQNDRITNRPWSDRQRRAYEEHSRTADHSHDRSAQLASRDPPASALYRADDQG